MKVEPVKVASLELKLERIRQGLTQHEVGLLAGLPSYIVSKIETGRPFIQPEQVEALVAALEQNGGKKA